MSCLPERTGKRHSVLMMKFEGLPAYSATSFVHGWKAIGAVFGVSSVIVKRWADSGAPIVMVTASTPCACLAEVWEWLKLREGKDSLFAGKKTPEFTERTVRSKDEPKSDHGKKINLEGRECPFCASVGTLRRKENGFRCDWCRQTFTPEELAG